VHKTGNNQPLRDQILRLLSEKFFVFFGSYASPGVIVENLNLASLLSFVHQSLPFFGEEQATTTWIVLEAQCHCFQKRRRASKSIKPKEHRQSQKRNKTRPERWNETRRGKARPDETRRDKTNTTKTKTKDEDSDKDNDKDEYEDKTKNNHKQDVHQNIHPPRQNKRVSKQQSHKTNCVLTYPGQKNFEPSSLKRE
jgi:hypothetical protein